MTLLNLTHFCLFKFYPSPWASPVPFPRLVLNSIVLHSVFPAQWLWFLVLDRFSHCLNHSHDLVFTKYCSLYYLSFLNSLSLITTCSLSAYLSFSLLYPVTHSFWDLQSINLFDSFIFIAASFLHWPHFFWLTGLYFYLYLLLCTWFLWLLLTLPCLRSSLQTYSLVIS